MAQLQPTKSMFNKTTSLPIVLLYQTVHPLLMSWWMVARNVTQDLPLCSNQLELELPWLYHRPTLMYSISIEPLVLSFLSTILTVMPMLLWPMQPQTHLIQQLLISNSLYKEDVLFVTQDTGSMKWTSVTNWQSMDATQIPLFRTWRIIVLLLVVLL